MVKHKKEVERVKGGATVKCTEQIKEDVRKLLCNGKDMKEITYSDIKKGLVKFHPDKIHKLTEKGKEEALENYKLINNVKDECYENDNNTKYVIKCPSPPKEPKPAKPSPRKNPSRKTKKEDAEQKDEKPTESQKSKPTPKPTPIPTISKHADCVRKVGTFAHIIPEFKIDKSTFKPKKLKKELPVVSPKLVALIDKIKELDEADNAKDKMTYKHCIYIDFKGTYAKVVAAAMIAYGFNMVYDKSMKIDEKELLKTPDKNFAFLSSSTIYDKTFKMQLRKQIVEIFNRRPDNINGKYIKYIILDSGYREGLDLFDTKYCHIIQDLPSSSDEKQAIGRNTRLCGQAGLKFHPTKGWPLHVYKYDIELTDPLQQKYDAKRMFDLFIRYNNIDIREINFAVDLDKIIPEVAVDEQLTRNIHKFEIDKEEGDGPTLFIEGADDPETKANAQAISSSSTLGIKRLFDLSGGSKKRRGNKNQTNPNLRPKPPITKKDFPGMYNYIKDRFSKYTWPKVTFENQCKTDMEGGAPKIVELTPSQEFGRLYFQPPSAYKGLLLDYSTGSGKCHAKDTPIIMYDGTIKMVQDIRVGDELMGDDSTPRKVLSLAQGYDDLYDVIPVKGDKYTVNSEHILCLKPTQLGITYKKNIKELPYYANFVNIKTGKTNTKSFKAKDEATKFLNELYKTDYVCEIAIKDYIKLSKTAKHILKGYRTGVNFSSKEVDFDPYIVGFWLGDGSKRDPVITSQDATILHYLNTTLRKYDLSLNHQSKYDYRISSYTGKVGSNKFLETLKKYNLRNNKHIPYEYKVNSKEIRLQVLAGLIDSDGSADSNTGYDIIQKNKNLAEDILFLARSLGFAAYVNKCQKSCTYKGEKKTGTYYRISISGNGLYEVPVKVARKKLQPRKQIKRTDVTGIDVKHAGKGDYYGFTLDGNNRYLLGDFTVTHNTCSAIAIASSSWETAGYTILYVTRHTLKVDVYKNMFRDVCSQTIKREIIKEEINIPDGPLKSPSKMLPDGWMQPISFKQLSNACLRKNDVYRELKNKNGETDPFRKTLIIIDEAHKMYSTDIVGSERPNTNAIVEAVQHSYKVSGKDSARLLLMTATPYTTRPMDFVKLINLMKEEKEQIPTDFNTFYEEYLDDEGAFSTAGKRFFTNDITGYVSYLNRSNDARQFAYPVFHQEVVKMSHSITEDKKKDLYKILRQMEELKEDIEETTEYVKEVKNQYRERIAKAKADCDKSQRGKKRDCIDKNVDPLKREVKDRVKQIKEDIEEKVDELQDMKKDSKKLVKEIKEAVKTDFSQEFALMNHCRLPVRPKQNPTDED